MSLVAYLLPLVIVAPMLLDLFDRAARRAGCSHKELALCMGIGEPQLSRQLRNEQSQHLSLNRVLQCPRDFVRELSLLLLEDVAGEKPVTAREVLDLVRPVMLRASARGHEASPSSCEVAS